MQEQCTSALLLGPTGTKTERERETFLIVIKGELLFSLKGRETILIEKERERETLSIERGRK